MSTKEFNKTLIRNFPPFLGVFLVIYISMFFIAPTSWFAGSRINLAAIVSLGLARAIYFRNLRAIHVAGQKFLSEK